MSQMTRDIYNELRRLHKLMHVFTSVVRRVSPSGIRYLRSRLLYDLKNETKRRKAASTAKARRHAKRYIEKARKRAEAS